jgi:hypothetical protein
MLLVCMLGVDLGNLIRLFDNISGPILGCVCVKAFPSTAFCFQKQLNGVAKCETEET